MLEPVAAIDPVGNGNAIGARPRARGAFPPDVRTANGSLFFAKSNQTTRYQPQSRRDALGRFGNAKSRHGSPWAMRLKGHAFIRQLGGLNRTGTDSFNQLGVLFGGIDAVYGP
jgi:hypothetical protein